MRKKPLYIYMCAGATFLLLQACFVAKEYERPELTGLDHLYRTDELPIDSVSIASVSWRELFTDPYLSGYIEEGLRDNLDIRIALERMIAAEAYMKQGKAGYFPSLQGRASMTHQELARNSQFGSFFNGSIEQFEVSGNFSWEADIWGKIRSSRRASLASYLQQVSVHKAVKTELVAEIATNYYQLLALDEQYEVTRKTIENRTLSLQTMQALKAAGNVTQVAVDGAAAQLYSSQALLIDLEKQLFRTENYLSFLLGKPGEPIKRGKLETQEPSTRLTLGVPALLLRNRPDVMAAEYSLVNSFELTNVARSYFYPSLVITGTGGFQSLQFEKLFDSGSLFANLVGSLTGPIFNKRQVRTNYEVAQAQQRESLLNFEKTVLLAGQEVSNALYDYKAEMRKYGYRQDEVAALRRAEINSEALLKSGFGTYLDLLTARQTALNAELNATDNKLQQLVSLINLYRALGGGWQ